MNSIVNVKDDAELNVFAEKLHSLVEYAEKKHAEIKASESGLIDEINKKRVEIWTEFTQTLSNKGLIGDPKDYSTGASKGLELKLNGDVVVHDHTNPFGVAAKIAKDIIGTH